jgi:HEAT repeat protein
MRHLILGLSVLAASNEPMFAQTLSQRVLRSEGTVQVIYPSKASACGDGRGMIGGLFGRSMYFSGDNTLQGRGNWSRQSCEPGPARAAVTVMSGEITRIRAYVGPRPADPQGLTIIDVSAADASAWLSDIVAHNDSRVASDAMLPLLLADAPEPWALFLRVARDSARPRGVRRSALDWLGRGVNAHLGIADAEDDTPDDEMRSQAVFVLSQRPKSESVPDLIELARSTKHPSARRAAIFWLGQTGDPRAADVFAELLGLR